MEELFNLTYKDEVELLKDEPDFETLGDEKYTHHEDMEARLYWAFCRPSGSSAAQIADENELVSIMAFNHSRLAASERFKLLHKEVIKQESLRVKIRNRTRMLFRSLTDDDFKELNEVLDLVPVFLDMAIDQLKNGRKWNDISADVVEATKFLHKAKEFVDEPFYEAFYAKLKVLEECEVDEVKAYIQEVESEKEHVDESILKYIQKQVQKWCEQSDLHILQKKSIEKLASKLIGEK